MESAAVLQSFEVLMLRADPEVAGNFLLAACYARAVAGDETPRDVADRLFKCLPHDNAWPAQRDALLAMLDDADE